MDFFISIVTIGKHSPSLSMKLDTGEAYAFAIDFMRLFGSVSKTEDGIKVEGQICQQKTSPKMINVQGVYSAIGILEETNLSHFKFAY